MDDVRNHRIGELVLRIDRSLCVGFGDCIARAPAIFALDDDDVVVLAREEAVELGSLLAACDACPVDALSVVDSAGRAVCASTRDAAARRC